MDPKKVHLRHVMLYEFHEGNNATQAANVICLVYGEGELTKTGLLVLELEISIWKTKNGLEGLKNFKAMN